MAGARPKQSIKAPALDGMYAAAPSAATGAGGMTSTSSFGSRAQVRHTPHLEQPASPEPQPQNLPQKDENYNQNQPKKIIFNNL